MDFKSVIILAFFIACSTRPEIKPDKSFDSGLEISKFKLDLEKSKNEGTELLAPVSYKKANKALQKSVKLDESGRDEEKIMKEVALGRSYLKRAEQRRKEATQEFLDILKAREAAINVKADTLFPGVFFEVEKRLKKEASELEKGMDEMFAIRRTNLIKLYKKLEFSAKAENKTI